MPVIGMGSAPDFTCRNDTKQAIIEAIEQGYRHFDTAAAYGSEQALGEATKEAIELGLVSREELFVTSKLWCTDNHRHLVLPALKRSLKTLQLEYLNLYLIHWPICAKPGKFSFPIDAEELIPLDLKVVWTAMEECQRLELTRAIRISNFSIKKLENLLSFIPY
ncbi:hypothetical protein L6164_031526 [Bauhinia variegata]|uniref:Uncharacterized protein n=1 Tax=Bauhinia variegata TaxID=167791 RepID=A0ACB9LFA2_BAUVA|nr:hypothetical protein L6164_031526 [Bauhinia variegata]